MVDEFEKLKEEIKNQNKILPSHLQGYEINTRQFNNILIKKDNFEYQVSSISKEKEGLKANVATLQDGIKLNKGRVSFSSIQSRKIFANECTNKEQNETNEKIKNQLMDIEEILSTIYVINKKEENKETTSYIPTEEEIKEAEDILKSPTLLYDIRQLFPKLMIAGEERNCLMIYLSCTSRILDSPISLTGKGESSVGKSYSVQKVLLLIPKEAYEDISEATKMSFYHAKQDAFKHKIMVLFEKPGTDQTDYSIRTMQSEKKLKLQITVKDPETGEFRTEIKEVDGPVAFITTTTSPNIHPENETRCFSWYGDDSEGQTLNTFEMTDAKYRGIRETSETELKKYQNIQRIIKPYPVLIPYVAEIRNKFPRKIIRARRDYGRLLALIETITILHQFQRDKKEVNGKEYLVSTLADYHIAKAIAEDALKQIIFELPPKSKQLVMEAREIILEKEAKGEELVFTIRELAQKSGDDRDTTGKWFGPALDRGYFEIKEEHKGSRAARYVVTDRKAENTIFLPDVEELANKYPDCVGKIYDPINNEKTK